MTATATENISSLALLAWPKREEITHYKGALELELMRGIKRTLDPHGLMNPGKVV